MTDINALGHSHEVEKTGINMTEIEKKMVRENVVINIKILYQKD